MRQFERDCSELTLAKAIDICRTSEVSKSQLKSLTKESAHVQVIKKKSLIH